MAEGGSLENCCTARYRGFKSYFLRQTMMRPLNEHVASCSHLQLCTFGLPDTEVSHGLKTRNLCRERRLREEDAFCIAG